MDANSRLQNFLTLFLQPRCCLCGLVCQSLQSPLCAICYAELPLWLNGCPSCGLPLRHDGICGACQQSAKPYQQMVLLGWYKGTLKDLVARFKYQKDPLAGRALAQSWLRHCLVEQFPEALIPVPCHPHKLANRSFNQAALIAHELGQVLHLRVDHSICQRIAKGEALVAQNRKQRLKQVKQLYRVSPCNYRHVAIVDDVVTTQATAMTLAQQLKNQGAQRVDIWALARTP